MVNIIKEDLDIEEALKKKLEFICSFCNTSCEIKNGSIRTIEKTNLSYTINFIVGMIKMINISV